MEGIKKPPGNPGSLSTSSKVEIIYFYLHSKLVRKKNFKVLLKTHKPIENTNIKSRWLRDHKA